MTLRAEFVSIALPPSKILRHLSEARSRAWRGHPPAVRRTQRDLNGCRATRLFSAQRIRRACTTCLAWHASAVPGSAKASAEPGRGRRNSCGGRRVSRRARCCGWHTGAMGAALGDHAVVIQSRPLGQRTEADLPAGDHAALLVARSRSTVLPHLRIGLRTAASCRVRRGDAVRLDGRPALRPGCAARRTISTIVRLNPGDIIATGSPGGVGHARACRRRLAGDIPGRPRA